MKNIEIDDKKLEEIRLLYKNGNLLQKSKRYDQDIIYLLNLLDEFMRYRDIKYLNAIESEKEFKGRCLDKIVELVHEYENIPRIA